VFLAVAVVGLVVGILIDRPPAATPLPPTPSAVPTEPITGSLCFSTRVLTSCAGLPPQVAFQPGQTVNFFVSRPFYADDVVHLIVSGSGGSNTRAVLTQADYQVIPNPSGMGNTIGQASDLIAMIPMNALGATCSVEAYMDGKLFARGSFELYPDSSPS
jgi:hypothetical protein